MFKRQIRLLTILILAFIAIFLILNFNRYEKLHMLNSINETSLQRGSEEMKKHRLVIAGITRDNAPQLPYVIKHIEFTGSFFADYQVIVFENDSKDGTKKILESWQARNPQVKVITRDFGYKKRPSISFMAQARNYYIEEMEANKKYDSFDILMVVDMDMHYGWDIRGVMDTFSKYNEWEAVCSNGITREGKMYDLFAFRNEEFPYTSSFPNYWKTIIPNFHKVFKVGSPMFPVYSCFGAMAFYKRQAIKGCRYKSVNDDCEHVLFHECLNGKMYMNPSQVIRYPISYESNLIKKIYIRIMSILYP